MQAGAAIKIEFAVERVIVEKIEGIPLQKFLEDYPLVSLGSNGSFC